MKEQYADRQLAEYRYRRNLADWSQQLLDLTFERGGVTYDFDAESFPDEGFAVSAEGYERVIPKGIFWSGDIGRYIRDHEDELFEEGYCLGIWIDGDKVYLDLSLVYEDQAEASLVARGGRQLAYYDLAKKEEVRI